jgi:hypothetical protein
LPSYLDGESSKRVASEPVSVGMRMVQHITCESKFFLAGKEPGRYLLHHNAKAAPTGGMSNTTGAPLAGYNYMPNTSGLKWGWGW